MNKHTHLYIFFIYQTFLPLHHLLRWTMICQLLPLNAKSHLPPSLLLLLWQMTCPSLLPQRRVSVHPPVPLPLRPLHLHPSRPPVLLSQAVLGTRR